MLKKIKTKYEVCCLSCHADYVDERLKKKQQEGWEIAGGIIIRTDKGAHKWFDIPMKRKIKIK